MGYEWSTYGDPDAATRKPKPKKEKQKQPSSSAGPHNPNLRRGGKTKQNQRTTPRRQ